MPGQQGGERNTSLAARFRTRADQLQNRPYVPYGAGARAKAEELLAKSRRGQRTAGQNWDLRQFPDDELRLARTDDNFARDLLRNYDPAFRNRVPTAEDIRAFKLNIDHSAGQRLFGNIQNGQPVPQIDPQRASRIREGFTARIAENQDLARQAQTALHRADRIAPLSPLHETARTLIQGNNPRESINLGRQEIEAAQRTNIPNAMAPYLARASQTPANYMTQYMQRYQPLMRNFEEEAHRDFLEHDMPTINNQFASRGAFYSSAREAALRKAMRDKNEKIIREKRNLTVHAQEQAMRDFNAERGHHLRQAEVAGSAHGAQREANIRAAEALRLNGLSGHEAARQQAADLSNMGNIEQRQEQHQRDVQLQEHEREQRYPQEQAMLEAALLNNVPPGSFQMGLSPAGVNPPPPNPLSAMGGAFAQMAGLGMQQQHQPRNFAHGGHVRQGYAQGDSVKRAASQLAEMRNHVQESPEEAEMRQSAQSFKNHNTNPMADYLFALGTHQLGNLQEDPMKTYAQGSNLGMQAYKQAQASNLSAQEKYNNLMDKINQTKMYQHDFISKHHGSMLQHEEMLRHHQAQEGESRRAHDIMSEHYKAKDNASLVGPMNMKLSATERKLANDAKKDLSRSLRMKKELSHLGELSKQTATGPVIGGIKSILPKTKVDNQIEVGTNKLILDMHQGMKNIPRSEEFLKRLETTKLNRSNYPEANEQALNLMNQGADEVMENSISTLLESGWSPEKIEKQFKIKIPPHLLDEGSGEELPQTEEPEQTSQDMVPVIGPDGQEWMIPQENVQAALQAGGQLAQ